MSDFRTILAKELAIDIVVPSYSGSADKSTYFDEVMRGESSGIENSLAKLSVIADSEFDRLTKYAQAIKVGIIISMINGRVPENANDWDMNLLATIGFNTSCEFKIKDVVFKFNPKSCAWEGSGLTLPMDQNTGLPLHPTLNNDKPAS